MALGKQIGEFSLTLNRAITTPVPGNGQQMLQTYLEGSMWGELGEGTVTGTMTIIWEPGQKSGTWTFFGTSMLPPGATNTINSQGAWEETGQYAWKCRGTGVSPDGHIVGVEFDGSLASGTWAGKLYAWS